MVKGEISKKVLYLACAVIVTVGMLIMKGMATVVNKTVVFLLGGY